MERLTTENIHTAVLALDAECSRKADDPNENPPNQSDHFAYNKCVERTGGGSSRGAQVLLGYYLDLQSTSNGGAPVETACACHVVENFVLIRDSGASQKHV